VSSLFADDAIVLQQRIGRQEPGDVEGPLVFEDGYAERWFLFVDHYGPGGVGYRPFVTRDVEAGDGAAQRRERVAAARGVGAAGPPRTGRYPAV